MTNSPDVLRLIAAAKAVHDEHWWNEEGENEWSNVQRSVWTVAKPKYQEFHDALAAIEHAQAAVGEGWIDCKTRMPSDDREVLVFIARLDELCIGYWDEGGWGGDPQRYPEQPTHWRELPASPKAT